ncbi:TPA: tripartite tricarboxylate transporter permease [Pseudomonas aeruginosa]
MKKRFTEEQILDFLKQAEAGVPVKELCRRHGFSDASFYTWRAKFGGMTVADAKRLKDLELENSRLKKLLAEAHLDIESLKVVAPGKRVSPTARREAVQEMQARTGISERRACQLIGLSRSVLRYQPRASVQNTELQAQLVELAQERRRFGYRRLHILLRRAGVQVNHKRIYRLYLGIPGSATAAVMLGGLMIWGLHPGPTLFVEQHDFVWGLIASMYLGNVVSLIVVLATVPLFASILRIPFAIVAPIIVMVCAIGAYSVHNAMLDVVLMLLFGALGYLFKKLGYPIAPLVLAAVLGDKAEDAFRQSMLFSDGQLSVFWSNPLVASLTGAALAMLLWPLLARCAGALFRRGRRSLRHAA